LRPIPGQEPKITERDVPVFDKAQIIPFPIVERPSGPTVSYRPTSKKQKAFISPTGEIVWRFRGGRGFTPYREPWNASGLLRVRGRLMTEPKIVAMARELEAGRHPKGDLLATNGTRVWTDYPYCWNALEPGPGPYVLRAAAELAAAGADISGSNLLGLREYHEQANLLRRLADAEANSLGPKIEEPDEKPTDLPLGSPPRTLAQARLFHRLDVEDSAWKRDAGKRKAKTSEYRDEETGEYGPQVRVGRDGRVVFKNGQPALNRGGVRVRGLNDYSHKLRVQSADGKVRRVDAQKAIERRGRKPKFGRAMTDAERQRLSRARRKADNEHSTGN
jgi:hypothetical protein